MALRPLAYRLLMQAVAVLGLVQAHVLVVSHVRGPDATWVESLRLFCSTKLARFDERAGPRPIAYGEYAGRLNAPLAATERLLWQEGFIRNPLSRLKTREGTPEVGSWVYRESPLAPRQLHLMLFPGPAGTTDVYAHEELSSVNPLYAPAHFTSGGQSLRAGVVGARSRLPLDTDGAPQNPPDGPWTDSTDHQGLSTRADKNG